MEGGIDIVSLNRTWWEHLAPVALHQRRREIDALLTAWCHSEYGSFWLRQAIQEHGVVRVRPGQAIPVVHVIALKGRPAFIAPWQAVRAEHRMVGGGAFHSGRPLAPGELALRPELRVEIVEDDALLEAASRGDCSPRIPGVRKPAQIFSVPANVVLEPRAWPNRAYIIYQHIFGDGPSWPVDGWFYVGVTTRSWQRRWSEHRRAAEAGSPLLFHRKLREEMAAGRMTYVHHKVMGVTDDPATLYATEEWMVGGHWDDARRLNMARGGKFGLRGQRNSAMQPSRHMPMPCGGDDHDRTRPREHPRKGIPASWLTERWKDNAWAVARICSGERRLSVEQILAIRALAPHHPPRLIAVRIGARSERQVRRVIGGKTYSRVV